MFVHVQMLDYIKEACYVLEMLEHLAMLAPSKMKCKYGLEHIEYAIGNRKEASLSKYSPLCVYVLHV